MPGLVTRQIRRGGGVVAQRISVSVPTDPSAGSVALIFNIVGGERVPEGGNIPNKTEEYLHCSVTITITVTSNLNFVIGNRYKVQSWN